MKFLILSIVCLAAFNSQQTLAAPSSKIDSGLLTTFQSQSKVNVFIEMKGRTKAALEKVRARSFATRESQINAVADALRSHAESSQASVRSFLDGEGITYKSFWISNQIFLNDASLALVERLSALPDVGDVFEQVVVQLDDIQSGPIADDSNPSNAPRANQWGVLKIRADQAWARSTGQGIVVGGIDTGVRGTHQDLSSSFRSDHGWRDPTAGQLLPYDDNGHGTHTVGTIAGANGIGVAPGAQWIACKGCASSACFNDHLAECGQFMLCPTNPDGSGADCNKAPHIVSNSWAGGRGNSWYDGVTDAWIAAGIIPVFAIGNAGSRCNSEQSPGDRNVIGVGSTVNDDSLSSFSSRGPTNDGRVKPEVSAPGSNVYSAYHTSDTAYTTMSGTSMACPHAAGTLALIQAVSSRRLPYSEIKDILQQSSTKSGLTSPGTNCGGSDTSFPNNAFGHGRIDAFVAVATAVRL